MSSDPILVVGDAMLDCYLKGEVVKLSPEAPVPVVAIASTETREGAAMNVLNNIESMGVRCIGLYGGGRNIIKTRLIGSGHHIARIDYDYPQEQITLGRFESAVHTCGIVLFIDYNKGSLANAAELIAYAKHEGKTVLVDPKGFEVTKYHGADVLKPNINEMRELVGGWHSEEDLRRKAEQLRQAIDLKAILLTRADKGMTLFDQEGWAETTTVSTKVVDVSGAGEAAIAAFAVALHRGENYRSAMQFASLAACLCVERFGTCVVTEKEVFG